MPTDFEIAKTRQYNETYGSVAKKNSSVHTYALTHLSICYYRWHRVCLW